MAESFARPALELPRPLLGGLEVAAAASAGQGLALDETGRLPSGVGGLTTGDYKISAQTASHGPWLLCDGSASPASLVALVGANLPDARGRVLAMIGTHTDVNAIGDSDGNAIGSRRPAHGTTGAKTFQNAGGGGGATALYNADATGNSVTETIGVTSSAPLDEPAYVVPGNLFIHG